MKRWSDIISSALGVLQHAEKYTYCLGCTGQLAESDFVKNQFTYYYEHGYKDAIGMNYEEWLDRNRGKYCFDCSGFIDALIEAAGHVYSSWNFGEMKAQASVQEGVAGSVLWKKGHVGLDIGYGWYLHFPYWNRSCELGYIPIANWEKSCLIDGVDYSGSNNR